MRLMLSTMAFRGLAGVFALALIIGSSLPSSDLPYLGGQGVDKVLHFLEYFVLGFLVTRGWGPGRQAGRQSVGPWLLVVLLIAFAALDELHQHWIPGRFVEFGDWVADSLGATSSFLLGVWVNRRASRPSQPS